MPDRIRALSRAGRVARKAKGCCAGRERILEQQSFHNYADYAMTEAFHSGLATLRERGRAQRCAIMCAEAVWWRCHRRIISDYLIAAGEAVFHILGPGHISQAQLTSAAMPGPGATLTYPAVVHDK